jgi:hypothetical protein
VGKNGLCRRNKIQNKGVCLMKKESLRSFANHYKEEDLFAVNINLPRHTLDVLNLIAEQETDKKEKEVTVEQIAEKILITICGRDAEQILW